MLIQATSSPDFVNYLTYLVCTSQIPQQIDLDAKTYNIVRVSAAMSLKTMLRIAFNTVPAESLNYIRSSVLLGLQDPDPQLRASAGNVIAELVRQGGLLAWPQLLQELLSLVG